MKVRYYMIIGALLMLGGLQGEDKNSKKNEAEFQRQMTERQKKQKEKAAETVKGWWDSIKSVFSYTPVAYVARTAVRKSDELVSGIASSGVRTADWLKARLRWAPLDRFREGVNYIEDNFYEIDLKNALNRLKNELIDLWANEQDKLENITDEAKDRNGRLKYNVLVAAVEALESAIAKCDTGLTTINNGTNTRTEEKQEAKKQETRTLKAI